jgi:P27 family predicted phage terminase small subunit
MRGRKPSPTHLKLVQGNPGRRPLKLDEFRPLVEIPKPPGHVLKNAEAAKEWRRVTRELVQYGIISKVDRAALVFYVINWARHVEAEDMIAKVAAASNGSGLFVKTPNGFPVQSPWVSVSNKAMELCCKFLIEFGMSPSARTRVIPGNPQLSLPGIDPKESFASL